MRALSFKDARIFRHLCHGTDLRTNRESPLQRRRERRQILGSYGWYSKTHYFHFQWAAIQGLTWLLTVIHDPRVRPSSSSFVMSRLTTMLHKKKRQDLDRNTWVTCTRFAVRTTVKRRERKEGSRIKDFSLHSTVNKLIKMINKI